MRHIATLTALITAAIPLGLLKAVDANAEAGLIEISPGADRPSAGAPAQNFTGEATVTPLFAPNDVRDFAASDVSFTPGARSNWHSHPAGQTLIVTSGTGWVQEWGGTKHQLKPGDVVWTPPGVKHWHGATDNAAMTHTAIQGTVDGSVVDWLEPVSDDQYLAS